MLTEKAILAKFKIRRWGATKLDKEVSKDVTERYHAKREAGHWVKILVDREIMKKVEKIAGLARDFHNFNTLPWMQDGVGILLVKNHFNYMTGMRKYTQMFEDVVNTEVLAKYNELIEKAKETLGATWKASDYPTIDAIKVKFGFEISYYPVPVKGDFRVHMDKDIVESMKRDMEAKVNETQNAAMKELWNRVYTVVNHMANKLSGDKPQKLYTSMIGNIEALVNLLPNLNINNDPNLERLGAEIKTKVVDAVDLDDLKTDNKYRKETEKEVKALVNKMEAYL